ncbi:unnamed protein product [Amoebophrya sp. A120]|nr:unnamed protein product [Amoebophrya sp. A120]|eukprot:GSA120T00003832001.1
MTSPRLQPHSLRAAAAFFLLHLGATRFVAAQGTSTVRLSFVCPYREEPECCPVWAGIAAIAAKHVNERNGYVIPEVATSFRATLSPGTANVTQVALAAQDLSHYQPPASTSSATITSNTPPLTGLTRNTLLPELSAAYNLVKASQTSANPAHGYLTAWSDDDVSNAHSYFLENDGANVPLIAVGEKQTSARYITDTYPKTTTNAYPNLFGMHPNDGHAIEQLAEVFVNQFGWRHFAVITEAPLSTTWSHPLKQRFEDKVWELLGPLTGGSKLNQGKHQGIVEHHIVLLRESVFVSTDGSGTLRTAADLATLDTWAETVANLRRNTPRVVIYVTRVAAHLEAMMTAAESAGMAGPLSADWTWVVPSVLALGGKGLVNKRRAWFTGYANGVWSIMEDNAEHSFGTGPPQPGSSGAKLHWLLEQEWKREMASGPLPTAEQVLGLADSTTQKHGGSAAMAVELRQAIPDHCQTTAPFVYDGVVAAAFGWDRFANDAAVTSFAEGLAGSPADPLKFTGLTGPVNQVGEIVNNTVTSWPTRNPEGLRYSLLRAQETGLNKLTPNGFTNSSEVTVAGVTAQLRPTGFKVPTSFAEGACYRDNVRCGSFGFCQDDGTGVGYPDGHCVCETATYVGQRCDIYTSVTFSSKSGPREKPPQTGASSSPAASTAGAFKQKPVTRAPTFARVQWSNFREYAETTFTAVLQIE